VSTLAGRWRLLREGAAPGAWNMAEDLALMEGDGLLPTLRLYTWDRPTLSLGYAQDADAVVDWAEAARLGVPVVRRPTGGASVLHDGALEVTYSVVAPESALPQAVVEAYRLLADALVAGLSRLGIEAALSPETVAAADRSAVCFEQPSRYELVCGGKKTVGSAQCRRFGRVLQHGAVPLHLDCERAVAVLRGDRAAMARRLVRHGGGLDEAAGRMLAWDEVADALTAGFETALGARFEAGSLTPAEQARRAAWLADGTLGPIAAGEGRAARDRLGQTLAAGR